MGGLTEKRVAELRADLKKLAADDFDTFCQIIGMDDTLAYVGLERMKGRSYGYISRTTGLKKETVAARCRKVFKK